MHVIVTGGSSGIGLAIAKAYAAKGDRVSLIARDVARLDQALRDLQLLPGGENAFAVSADVSISEELTSAVKACETKNGPCDVLITSAGIVEPADFDSLSQVLFDRQVTVNLLGTANAIRAVYSGMKARGRGTIMVVSSGAALIGIHGYSAYCASKSALGGLVEALQTEATGTGVRISICFPPDTFTRQYVREMTARPWQAGVLMGIVKPWTAEAVAKRIVGAVTHGRSAIYFTPALAGLAYFGPLVKPVLMLWYRWRLGRSDPGKSVAAAAGKLKTEASANVDASKF